jgi:hypothetical protein
MFDHRFDPLVTAVLLWLQEPPCDLALSPQTIGSGQLVLGLPKDSTLLQPLSAALLQLSEAGYMAGGHRAADVGGYQGHQLFLLSRQSF